MKANEVSIKYLWWISDKEKWLSLTGSSTLMTVDLWWQKVKILTDIGMFQWWSNCDEYNKKIDEEIINCDYVIITHAHMDHIWRLPLLVKNWFKGRILMTGITKELMTPMLNDYVSLVTNLLKDLEDNKKKSGETMRTYFNRVKIHEDLSNNKNITIQERDRKRQILNKYKKDASIENYIEFAKSILAKNNILKESDIWNLQNNLPSIELLYDENDIKKTQSLVSVLEIWDNLDLDTRITISDVNDEIVDKIPEMIMWWYNKKIYVLPHVKKEIVSKWNKNFNPEGIISQLEKNEKEKLETISSNLKNALNILNENNLEEITETILDENNLDKRQQIRSNLFYINHLEWKKINLFKENDLEYNLDLLQKWDNAIVINSSQKRIFVNFLKQKVENYSYFESLLIEVDENFSFDEVIYFDEKIEWNLAIFKKSNVLLIDSEKEDEFNQFLNNFFIDKNQTKKRKRKNLEKFWNEIKETKSFEKEILLLRQYNISNETDLENFIKSEKEKIWLIRENFSKKEYIENFSSFLEPVFTKWHEKIIDSFKLRFFDAWHIEWSIQAVVTIVTKQVEHTLNESSFNWSYKKEHKNFLFTWDLGKFTQANLSWSPEIPEYKFDYVQIESTYADRNHPDKDEEFKKLLDELNWSLWKVVIAAFSLQRTQEIIVELLKNKAENKDLYPEFKVWKESIKLIKKRFLELEKIENPNEEQLKEKLRHAAVIDQINDNIAEVQRNLFTWNIILDSPLATKVTNIFTKSTKWKYDLLLKEVQEEIFSKEIVRILEKWEYKEIYKDDRIKSKDIIISSGWMLQWWSIMNHIKNMIDDPNSKIIFTWYQAEWTLGHEILSWKKQIIIEGKVYDVKCKIVQIKWYSSHIWKDDIISYTTEKLKYSKKAKLALVHWDETRENLAKDIRKITKWNIEVIVPKLWDEVKIKI